MSKQIKELRNFIEGTNSAPSATDVPEESPTYSLNLETLDEEGKLKGSKKNVPLKQEGVNVVNRIDLGAQVLSGNSVSYSANIYGNIVTSSDTITDNADPVWIQNKSLRKSFVAGLSNSDYVQSATLHPYTVETGGIVHSPFVNSGATLEGAINATVTQITFTTTTYTGNMFNSLDIIKINNEYMRITSIVLPDNPGAGYTFKLNVDRGWSFEVDANGDNIESTPASHAQSDELEVQQDFRTVYITYVPAIETATGVTFSKTVATTTSSITAYDETDNIEIYARNMLLIDHKDVNSNITTSDLVYYDKNTTVNPPEYKMKVLENFYKDNNDPIKFIDIENSSINTSNDGFPESVSLAKGPNAVYIGTGSTASTKPQWLGKPTHAQFGSKIEEYILEDAELKAIDDGNAIFNLSHIEAPFVGSEDPITRDNNIYNVALSGTKRYIYAFYNGTTAELKGKQFRSTETIGFVPTAIGSSKKLHDMFEDPSTDNKPLTADTWDSGTNDATNFNKHDATVSYHLVAEAGSRDKIYVFATKMHFNGGAPENLMIHNFGHFMLEHHLVIDAALANITRLDANDKILRPPKNGSYINDIYEKNGQVYVQYGHNSGFTFDEEYLYTFPIADLIDHAATTMGDSTKVVAKPITPPIFKTKNHGKSFEGSGYDFYASEEVCDFSGVTRNDDVGGEGIYNMYSNYIKWKNIDVLGFTKKTGDDDELYHCLYERTYWDHSETKWVTTEPDIDDSWNKAYAKADGNWSDSDASEYPGWTSEGDSAQERAGTDPDYRSNMYWDNHRLHPTTYGFETCSVFTQRGGIYNITGSDTVDGLMGCVVFIDGKQHTNNLKTDVGRYYTSAPYRVKYYLHNEREPEITTLSEQCILTTTKDALGVAQRIIPYVGSDRVIQDGTDHSGDANSHRNLNGIATTDWTSGEPEHGIAANSIDWGDGSIKAPQKMAWRSGCYLSGYTDANYPNNRPKRMQTHHFIRLGQADAPSNQDGNNFTVQAPNAGSGLLGIAKNYKGGNIYVTSSRTADMDKINTYISKWTTSIPQSPTSHTTWVPNNGNTNNPLMVKSVGASVLQNIYGSGTNDRIGLFPTAGRLQTGEVELDYANGQYATNGDPDAEFGDKFFKYASGVLSVGLTPSFTDVTELVTDTDDADGDGDTTDSIYLPGNFNAGNVYTWKMSLLYDGYQEGPLSSAEFTVPIDNKNYNGCYLALEMSEPPKRVSQIVIYRKNGVNEYYRMVAEVDLSSGWNYDAAKDTWKKIILDSGRQSATYEAITGIPENLENTMVNYSLSTVAQGHLIVADCYHPDIKQGQNFIYKSEPNAFSNFNWTKNWCVLPTRPTAITWFAGKIFAFDLNNMYRIDLNNLVLEDTYEGIGCTGPDGLIVTDMGMFFCDNQGLYWHNGQKAENIGSPILKSSYKEDETDALNDNPITDFKTKANAWQDINHKVPPKVIYDPKTLSVFFCFQNAKTYTSAGEVLQNGAWKFNITRKRLDLVSLPEINGTLTGKKNDSYLSGDGLLYQIAKSNIEREEYSWHSKKFDLGIGTEEKAFYSIKLTFNNKDAATRWFSSQGSLNELAVKTNRIDASTMTASLKKKQDENTVVYKIAGKHRKAKWLSFEIRRASEEIDSVGITYRPKKVK